MVAMAAVDLKATNPNYDNDLFLIVRSHRPGKYGSWREGFPEAPRLSRAAVLSPPAKTCSFPSAMRCTENSEQHR